MADDPAEIYDGIRAEFPLSFGKQSKSQTPLEAIHNTTRRNQSLHQQPPSSSSSAADANDLPSLSSSSKSWLNSLRSAKIPNPNPNPNDSDASLIGPPRPPQPNSAAEDDGDALIGPPPPPPGGAESDDDGEMIGPPAPARSNMEDSDSDAEEENKYRIPVSNEIVLKGHTKVVSALAIDHTGSRVVTGSYDYSVRMYDFQGMNAKLQSFRQLEPSEGHQVRTISWSPTADRFLCVTGSAQAKVNPH